MKNRNFLEEPPCSSDFSDIQILLINYFSNSKTNSSVILCALSLIGYWYKNQYNLEFKTSFKDDKDYWDSVVPIMNDLFNFKDHYSFRAFYLKIESKKYGLM
ncbi:hypothetical protein PGTUg99_037063 [Puccinia graminis f. sp. tritici]|uniref:Uncharacterized protein n=1 Tax=Puccinia graminis f. sp. tritici TaxID=56615 RepID=A0A5B0R9R5_PUCGR|nr:hypothetical protein PGTUg99_037063 [Puccinia graminis f. sp. tritici]